MGWQHWVEEAQVLANKMGCEPPLVVDGCEGPNCMGSLEYHIAKAEVIDEYKRVNSAAQRRNLRVMLGEETE